MEKEQIQRFKKGFNHGWALSEADINRQVIDSVLNSSQAQNGSTNYIDGFKSGVEFHQKEMVKEQNRARLKGKAKPYIQKSPDKGKSGPDLER